MLPVMVKMANATKTGEIEMKAKSVILAALAFIALTVAPAHAQHEHGEEHHDGGHESSTVIPEKPEEIVAALLSKVVAIESFIETSQLTKIHVPAFEAKDLAEALDAREPFKGDDAAALSSAVKRIGSAAKLLDKYGDANDLPKTKAAYKTFDEGVQAIRKLFPKAVPSHYWTCPMHPEVWKAGEGKCPKCGMKLEEKGHADPGHGTTENHGEEDGHEHGAAAHEHRDPTLSIAVAPRELNASENTSMVLTIHGPDGLPVGFDGLEEAHTKKIHLLVIDPSLSDYHHIHPEPGRQRGEFTFEFLPKKSGQYFVFADLVPIATGVQEYSLASLSVSGTPDSVVESTNNEVTVGGLTVRILFEEPQLVAGKANLMTLSVIGADGKPFEQLEPLMGAYAHLVAFDKSRANIAHVHPMGKEPKSDSDRGGPELQFHLNFTQPGFQKLFAQFQVGGKDVYAPFGLNVLDNEQS